MKRLPFAASLVLAALAAGPPARAADPGVTAAPVLQVPLGARAMGMGSAFTAVANDATALQYNPAGLARLSAHEADFTLITAAGESTLQHVAYGGPTRFPGISGNGFTSAGASLLFSQSGDIQINRLNDDGSLASTERTSAGSDLVLAGGYAERVGMTPVEFKGGSYNIDHFLGVGGKYLRSTLVGYSATAYAGDVGYLVHMPETGWSLGASGLNLGGKLRFREQSDPLPATLRAGLAWQGGVPGEHNVIAALDGDYVPEEENWHVNAGAEYFWERTYGGRIGYQFNRGDQGGLTIGLGMRWSDRMFFDYAWAIGDQLGAAHRITVSYRFGAVPLATRGRQRRPFIEAAPERERMEGLNDRRPAEEDAPRPRPIPRERPMGVPGWIY